MFLDFPSSTFCLESRSRRWRCPLNRGNFNFAIASPDTDFERKAADVIALYLTPPEHAVVFCVDEKTAIQVLDRTVRVLPLSPGRAERHGFEYVRHGTVSLYAAPSVGTGPVEGMTAARHTSADLQLVAQQVELWIARIEPDCIARGIFTSVPDPRRKLMQNIRTHDKQCHPFVWSYSDPTRRIRVHET